MEKIKHSCDVNKVSTNLKAMIMVFVWPHHFIHTKPVLILQKGNVYQLSITSTLTIQPNKTLHYTD